LHSHYSHQDWIDKPSLFAETAIHYFPQRATILELGAGQGQDSRYFADNELSVTATDIEQSALDTLESKLTPNQRNKVTTATVDLREALPYSDSSFDVVYAHLSLHYFDLAHTKRAFSEIARVLKPGGILAFFVNSVNDPEYNTGTRLEADYFQIGDTRKRYFSVESASELTQGSFETKLLDDLGETYKDADKGVHRLIRYIGQKPKQL